MASDSIHPLLPPPSQELPPAPSWEEQLVYMQDQGPENRLPRRDRTQDRLHAPLSARLWANTFLGSACGGVLGFVRGARQARLQFRAENAHRMPTTTAGWYLYHKSKNNFTALLGMKQGFRIGFRIVRWSCLVTAIEDVLDGQRGIDMANTVMACVTAGGCFSLWSEYCAFTLERHDGKVMGKTIGSKLF